MAYVKGPEWVESAKTSWSANESGESSPAAATRPLSPAQLDALAGPNTNDFTEVIRFDATPGWIVARWPRVVTGLAHLDLQGYRVPLVTGAKVDDLAGAMTYYFNSSHQVEWITFQGTTGDTRRLVQLVTAGYQFSPRPTNSPGVFLYEAPEPSGRASSYLWVRPAGLIKADDPHRKFEVTLVLQRPAGGIQQPLASLPPTMQAGQPVGASAWTPVLLETPYH